MIPLLKCEINSQWLVNTTWSTSFAPVCAQKYFILNSKEKERARGDGGQQAVRLCPGSRVLLPPGAQSPSKGISNCKQSEPQRRREGPREESTFGSVPKPRRCQLANFVSSCLSCHHQPCQGLCRNPEICQRWCRMAASQAEGKRDPKVQTRRL